jgi:hypothetical protein
MALPARIPVCIRYCGVIYFNYREARRTPSSILTKIFQLLRKIVLIARKIFWVISLKFGLFLITIRDLSQIRTNKIFVSNTSRKQA